MRRMSRRGGLALAAGGLAFAVVTTVVGAASGAPALFLIADFVLGTTFIACGIAAVWLRAGSPAGPALMVAGALWFVGSYAPSLQPVVMHLGFAFEGYYDLVLAGLLLILSSPMQRPAPRWLIGGLAAAMLIRSAGRLLLADPAQLGCDVCPPNPFAVMPNAATFEAVDALSSLAIAAFAATVGVVAVRRLVGAGPIMRRLRWPVLVAGVVAMAAATFDALEYAWTNLTQSPLVELSEPLATLVPWTVFAARTLVPVGFLSGTLRARSAPGPLGPLTATLEAPDAPIGDAIRRALGDPSAILLLRGPAGAWTAEDGSLRAYPQAADGRAVTLVGPADEPIAALVHDAAVLDQPELLEGVARIVRLALENNRLEAELRDQLRAVTESRERIVTAGEEERRRLERDLHDGAQQRLIGVTLALQRTRSTAEAESASGQLRSELDAAAEQTGEAIRELRELARGIHPAILEDSGLEAAVGGLARRAGIPVELSVRLNGRLPQVLESTAYFTVAEALTNAQRHARATHASVSLVQAEGRLEVAIDDDGAGGADPDRGTGLRGLSDRVQALGGHLEVVSDPGRGTQIRATLPVS
jgi:signal transduction histidine kinase